MSDRVSKFTPGPWVMEEHPDYQGFSHLTGGWIAGGHGLVAEVRGAVVIAGQRHEEHTANGQLIAAAPDMLAALVEASRFLDYFANGRRSFTGGGTPRSALDLVEAAIAKALGQSVPTTPQEAA